MHNAACIIVQETVQKVRLERSLPKNLAFTLL